MNGANAFKAGQTLRVVDDAAWMHGAKPRKPPFTQGEIVTVETAFGAGLALKGKSGLWKPTRFVPHSAQG